MYAYVGCGTYNIGMCLRSHGSIQYDVKLNIMSKERWAISKTNRQIDVGKVGN